jgi:flavin-dependent dehydrogenase
MPQRVVDAIVVGGGPAGSAIARLLASWGRTVCLLARPIDRARGLAESLPPSTRKLLAEIGVLDAVDAAGFLPATGNTSWWAHNEPRVEAFDIPGYQVFRPDFDDLLLKCAREAGAGVRTASVRRVDCDDEGARVDYDESNERKTVRGRFLIDASGRRGIFARRFRHMDDVRMFAQVGVWRTESEWNRSDPCHTIVETFDDGWAWSVPTSRSERHVGFMVGVAGLPYQSLLDRTRSIRGLVEHAVLARAFACDASTYSSSRYAGPGFLLAGDAASFIDPLSSFGVKKALASAWLGAVTVHTCLTDPARRDVALDFFGNREREMQSAHAQATRAFAREAYSQYRTPFWERRAAGTIAEAPSEPHERSPEGSRSAAAVFERFKASPAIELQLADSLLLERRPVVRGREIVLEDALEGGLRFLGNVDLLELARMAPRHRQVPDLFEAYCRDCAPVPLPNVVSGLSLLVAKGILYER